VRLNNKDKQIRLATGDSGVRIINNWNILHKFVVKVDHDNGAESRCIARRHHCDDV